MGERDTTFTPATKLAKSLHELARVGVIDIGSNSVRLVVFDGAARAPAYFYNEKVLAGLGRDVRLTGKLHPGGRKRALKAIARFVMMAKQMGLNGVTAVATAAVRDADDGPDFVAEIERKTGLIVRVISGEEEAALSAQGVLLGRPNAHGLVCDMGGASMEIAQISDGKVHARATTQLAPLSLAGLDAEARAKILRETLKPLAKQFSGKNQPLYLVGGSWRAIGKLDMVRRKYPLRVLQSYTISQAECLKTSAWIKAQDVAQLKEITPDTSSARLELLPLAARILPPVIETFQPSEIVMSSYGLREGMLYAQMTPELRALDPLLEAAETMEAASARFPGLGVSLYKWMKPLYPKAKDGELRLIRAAALLHDVAWRAHPDYRAEVCFETATRANLGGLRHEERIFLGLALTRRYKSSVPHPQIEALTRLLPPDVETRAIALGRALRLGAMLSAGGSMALKHATLRLKKDVLELSLDPETSQHAGETVERRLSALASAHGVAGKLILN